MSQATPPPSRRRAESLALRYLDETRGPGYTLFLVLPFAFFYELGLALFHRADAAMQVRNGADAILRALFFPHWLEGHGRAVALLWGIFGLLLLFGAILALGWQATGGWRVKPRMLAAAYAEAFGWSLLLFVGWLLLLAVGYGADAPRHSAAEPADLPVGLRLVLSCGAGVYEELLFRLLLVSGLVLFMRGLVGASRPGAVISAVVLAALLFAAVHYVGPYEQFDGSALAFVRFGFRVAAGVFFSGLLALRSFGMAVAAHALYDIIVTGIEALAA